MLFSINLWGITTSVTNPSNTTVVIGGTATFTATGTTPAGTVSYQWQYRSSSAAPWANIPSTLAGATVTGASGTGFASGAPSTLTIAGVNASLGGLQVQVIVTGSVSGTATSAAATMTVVPSIWFADGAGLAGVGTFERGVLLASGHVMAIGGDLEAISLDTTPGAAGALGTVDTWVTSNQGIPQLLRPTTTLLPTGQVLIAGGLWGATDVTNAYLYRENTATPGTGDTLSAVGSMNTARDGHTASLLFTGQVLVAGGTSNGVALSSIELFNPSTSTWASPSAWLTAGAMNYARYRHAATVLQDGTVLVTGGQSSDDPLSALASAEIYNPVTNTWSIAGNMTTPRVFHTSTLLPNGQVLIAGGINALGETLNSAEIFTPNGSGGGTFTPLAATMIAARNQHTATLMNSGLVLIAGGANSAYLVSSEYFNYLTGTFAANPTNLNAARDRDAAWFVPSGEVLVAGGTGVGDLPLASAEVFFDSNATAPIALPAPTIVPAISPILAGPLTTATCSSSSGYLNLTYTWTLLNATNISYPYYPNTSTVSFTAASNSSVGLYCMTTTTLGISAVSAETILPVGYGLPTLSITNDTPTPNSTTPTVTQGSEITFTAVIPGSANPTAGYTYQWQMSTNAGATWTNLGTGITQQLASVPASDNGLKVQVLVSNAAWPAGTPAAISPADTLYVAATPTFATAPTSLNVMSGATNVTLSAAITPIIQSGLTAVNTVTNEWCTGTSRSTTVCVGAITGTGTAASDNLGTLVASGVTSYYLVATNTLNGLANSVASAVVTVTVNAPPSVGTPTNNIAGQGVSVYPTIVQGGNITFSTVLTGGYPAAGYTYQWQTSPTGAAGTWTPVGTASTLPLTGVPVSSNGEQVEVVVSNTNWPAGNSVTSTAVSLYVIALPVITTQPASLNVMSGATATFTGAITPITQVGYGASANTVNYEWCTGATPSTSSCVPAGSATASLSPSTAVGGTSNYYLIVVNSLNGFTNAVASNDVTLTVNSLPTAGNISISGAYVLAPTGTPGTFTAGNPNPTITQGSNITFNATLSGIGYPTSGFTYQWQYQVNGTTWTNWTTGASATVTNAQAYSNALSVRVLVSNPAWPSTASAIASTADTMYVVAVPAIATMQPNLNVISPATPTLSASITVAALAQVGIAGPAANVLTYEWCTGASPSAASCPSPVGGGTVASNGLAVSNPLALVSGVNSYYLIVTNTLNGLAYPVLSGVVTVTDNVAPSGVAISGAYTVYPSTTPVTFTAANTTPTVTQNSSITFNAAPLGAPYPTTGFTYQWQYQVNGTTWANWTAASSATIASAQPYSNGLNLRVLVSNPAWPSTASPVISGTDVLSVVSAPTGVTVAVAPSAAVAQGVATTFTASSAAPAAAGQADAAITYAWYKVGAGAGGADALLSSGPSLAASSSCASTYTIAQLGSTSTLVIGGTCLNDAGSYYAKATGVTNGVSNAAASPSASVALAVTVGTWTTVAGAPATARYDALSLMLPDGTFWAAGGQNDSGVLSNDTIYNAGAWTTSGGTFVAGPHLDGTATLMANGAVLIAGGSDGQDALTGVELYTPSGVGAGAYSDAGVGQLANPTTMQVAALLPNQDVLLAGGQNGWNDTFYSAAYLYNPATKTWSASSSALGTARAGSRAVTLSDARILVLGGEDVNGVDNAVDIYDANPLDWQNITLYWPQTYSITNGVAGDFFAKALCSYVPVASTHTPCMVSPRIYETATLLNDGRVLIAGGMDNNGNVLSSMEIWDPTYNNYSGGFAFLGNMSTPRMMQSAVLLENGKVLIFGGFSNASGTVLNTAEVIDPNFTLDRGPVTIPATNLTKYRALASSTLLTSGSVLTVGGYGKPTAGLSTQTTGETLTALEGYSAVPAVPTGVITDSQAVATFTLAGQTGTATLTPTLFGAGTAESLNLYVWNDPSATITSGQGSSSIHFTTGTGPTYPIDVLVTNQYGFSRLYLLP